MVYDFGIRLKALRKAKGIGQEELAQAIGVQRASVSQYENSGTYPTVDRLIRIARYFGVTTDYLLGLTEENRFNMDRLNDEQYESVLNLIRQLEQANARERG